MKNQPLYRRFLYAWDGLTSSFRTEKSFRTHVLVLALVLVSLVALKPPPVWCAIFFLTLGAMLAAELINTAVEKFVDRMHPEIHPMIKEVKDALAAAVLVVCIAAGGVLLAFLYATGVLILL